MSDQSHSANFTAWHRPMMARLASEEHRTATALELFFDLCVVTAVAQASTGFHHQVTGGRIGIGVLSYAFVFFAIWWAWMNFTWFASAYDTDDVPYRLATLVQITGALVMAGGVPHALTDYDFTVVTYGYVIMRLAMVAQWIRAACSDPARRSCCLRYAAGIALVQAGWVARLALPGGWDTAGFVMLAIAELAVPVWAERAAPTTWHPHHIAERYGLFTLIVLGESVSASTTALQSVVDANAATEDLVITAIGGLLSVYAMWWIYFSYDVPRRLTSLPLALRWGYGHYFVFASAAGIGAGLAINVDHAVGHTYLTDRAAAASYTLPAAVFVAIVWALHLRRSAPWSWLDILRPVAALAILAATLTSQPVLATGLVLTTLVIVNALAAPRIRVVGNGAARTG